MKMCLDCPETATPESVQGAGKTEYRPAVKEAQLVRRVARNFRVSESALYAIERTSARETLARHTAMYLMHVLLGRNYSEVGAWFRRHRTSVFHACARIEDRRDDRIFDARLIRLERQLGAPEDPR